MGCDCETERDYDEDYYQCEYCTDMCDVCNRCLDHRCECTKADREAVSYTHLTLPTILRV